MLKIKVDGLESLTRRVEGAARRFKEADGEVVPVPYGELFHPGFMARHTKFASFDAMASAPGGSVFDDAFVAENTNFQTWDEMRRAGSKEWAKKKALDLMRG
jgi:hypothetical protein